MEAINQLKVEQAKLNEKHAPSKLQADTLFHFTDKLEWLLDALKNKMLSPRYYCENIEDFDIPGLPCLAYPMKCFCDIKLHSLKDHIEWYGAYGIAFSKQWGMEQGIQPVQYINKYSPLCKDMSECVGEALVSEESESGSIQEKLEDFSMYQLMYWKPYQGHQSKRVASESELKCFSDESEWRYIPNVRKLDMPMIIRDENILKGGLLSEYSNSLNGKEQVSLVFQYQDVKYIILEKKEDYKRLEEAIEDWNIGEQGHREILSKVFIWDIVMEDL